MTTLAVTNTRRPFNILPIKIPPVTGEVAGDEG